MGSARYGGSTATGGGAEELIPVLLVEDEVFIRLANADWLRDAGYAVIEAAGAQEALDIIATGQQLALLATDINMPGKLDGLDLAARFRSDRPGLPVVLLSAHVPGDYSELADAALSKPFSASQLVAVVEGLIGRPWQTKNHGTGLNNAC